MNRKSKPVVEDQRHLRGATAWQRKPSPAPEPIGLAIENFLKKRERQYKKAEKMVDAWDYILPEEIRKHCRLAGFIAGVLTVEVSTGPFLHQMQLIRSQLLREIQEQCPTSGIREIRILPGWANQEK